MSTAVSTSERSKDPRQPSRLLKKKNTHPEYPTSARPILVARSHARGSASAFRPPQPLRSRVDSEVAGGRPLEFRQ